MLSKCLNEKLRKFEKKKSWCDTWGQWWGQSWGWSWEQPWSQSWIRSWGQAWGQSWGQFLHVLSPKSRSLCQNSRVAVIEWVSFDFWYLKGKDIIPLWFRFSLSCRKPISGDVMWGSSTFQGASNLHILICSDVQRSKRCDKKSSQAISFLSMNIHRAIGIP